MDPQQQYPPTGQIPPINPAPMPGGQVPPPQQTQQIYQNQQQYPAQQQALSYPPQQNPYYAAQAQQQYATARQQPYQTGYPTQQQMPTTPSAYPATAPHSQYPTQGQPQQPMQQPQQQYPSQQPLPPKQPNSLSRLLQKAGASDSPLRSFLHNARGFIALGAFLITIALAAFMINEFVFQSYYVDGTSMTPTLQNNDRLIIDKTGRTWAHLQGKGYLPQRGDIIVLDSSLEDEFGKGEQLIKRVIGLPGDTVIIQNGVVMIRNEENPEGFNPDEALGLDLEATYTNGDLVKEVPEDTVFVMGDNRGPNGSFDSRAFGPVELANIEGKLAVRIFPFNNIKTF